jgi:hypothetical protein
VSRSLWSHGMRPPGNDWSMSTEAAARELHEELGEIAAIEGCTACECLLGVAAQALADLRRLPGDEARDAEADLRRLLAAGEQAPHGCLECDPCLPVKPSSLRAAARVVAATAAAEPLDTLRVQAGITPSLAASPERVEAERRHPPVWVSNTIVLAIRQPLSPVASGRTRSSRGRCQEGRRQDQGSARRAL